MSDLKLASNILLGDIASGQEGISNRTNLGPKVPIRLFQALRLVGMGVAMDKMVGEGANAIVYQAGQSLGMSLGSELVPRANGDLDTYLGLGFNGGGHKEVYNTGGTPLDILDLLDFQGFALRPGFTVGLAF